MGYQYAYGIDIGGTTVKIGLFTAEGELEKKWEIPTRKEENGAYILPDIAEAIRRENESCSLDSSAVAGIGIGVPGPVLQEKIVNRCANLGWGVKNIVEEMTELTGVSCIKAGNDANVAALGEMWRGGGRGHENLVMVTLGTGVGGAVIINGKIVPGAFGAGGEFGHMQVRKDESILCGCGKKGHLEQYASATGIVRKAKEVLSETDTPSVLRNIPQVGAKDVFDAAKAGDELALSIVDFVGDTLGAAMALVSCVVDPEVFVFGGGVSKAGSILIDTIRKHFAEYAFHASEGAGFELASLGNDAGMYGAVKMILSTGKAD